MKLCSLAVLEEFELATGASWKRGVAERGIAHVGRNAAKNGSDPESKKEQA